MELVETKARRRILRFIRTGKPQARVRKLSWRFYEYKVTHYGKSLFFWHLPFGKLHRVK